MPKINFIFKRFALFRLLHVKLASQLMKIYYVKRCIGLKFPFFVPLFCCARSKNVALLKKSLATTKKDLSPKLSF